MRSRCPARWTPFAACTPITGRWALDQILAPAIRYADAGVPVAPRVAFDWADDAAGAAGRARGGSICCTGTRADGRARCSARPVRPRCCAASPREGRDGFYEGEVAEDMIASLRALGGCHTLDDLAATRLRLYASRCRAAIAGLDLLEHPPNGQGATAILMLNILNAFRSGRAGPVRRRSARIWRPRRQSWPMTRATASSPIQAPRLDHMLSPETADRLAALIDPAPRHGRTPAPLTEAVHSDTVYLTVVDRDRMAVSLIYSIFWGFGSGLASRQVRHQLPEPRRGVHRWSQGHPNEAAGGKRPMHTIIPGDAARKAGRVIMPFGVMGGGYQPSGHARFVTNLRRLRHGPAGRRSTRRAAFRAPTAWRSSAAIPTAVRAELAAMGHRVSVPDEPLGGAQAILIGDDGVLIGRLDPRKDGCALGY